MNAYVSEKLSTLVAKQASSKKAVSEPRILNNFFDDKSPVDTHLTSRVVDGKYRKVFSRDANGRVGKVQQDDGNNVQNPRKRQRKKNLDISCTGVDILLNCTDNIDKKIDRCIDDISLFKLLLGLHPPGICVTTKNLQAHIMRIFEQQRTHRIEDGSGTFTAKDIICSLSVRYAVKNYGLPEKYVFDISSSLVDIEKRGANILSPDGIRVISRAIKDQYMNIEHFLGDLSVETSHVTEFILHVKKKIIIDLCFLVCLGVLFPANNALCAAECAAFILEAFSSSTTIDHSMFWKLISTESFEFRTKPLGTPEPLRDEADVLKYWDNVMFPFFQNRESVSNSSNDTSFPAYFLIIKECLREPEFSDVSYSRKLKSDRLKKYKLSGLVKNQVESFRENNDIRHVSISVSGRQKRNNCGRSKDKVLEKSITRDDGIGSCEFGRIGTLIGTNIGDTWTKSQDMLLMENFLVVFLKRESSLSSNGQTTDSESEYISCPRTLEVNILHRDYEREDLSISGASYITKHPEPTSGNVLSSSRARKRLSYLLQKYKTVRKLCAIIMSLRPLVLDQRIGNVLNGILDINSGNSLHGRSTLETAVMTRLLQVYAGMNKWSKEERKEATSNLKQFPIESLKRCQRELLNKRWLQQIKINGKSNSLGLGFELSALFFKAFKGFVSNYKLISPLGRSCDEKDSSYKEEVVVERDSIASSADAFAVAVCIASGQASGKVYVCSSNGDSSNSSSDEMITRSPFYPLQDFDNSPKSLKLGTPDSVELLSLDNSFQISMKSCHTGQFSRSMNKSYTWLKGLSNLKNFSGYQHVFEQVHPIKEVHPVKDGSQKYISCAPSTTSENKLYIALQEEIKAKGPKGMSLSTISENFQKGYNDVSNNDIMELVIGMTADGVIIEIEANERIKYKELFELPETKIFVHSEFSSLYLVDTATYRYEASCPWMNLDGSRNDYFYNMLKSKICSELVVKPGSSFAKIHSTVSILSNYQLALLISLMIDEGCLQFVKSNFKVVTKDIFSVNPTSEMNGEVYFFTSQTQTMHWSHKTRS